MYPFKNQINNFIKNLEGAKSVILMQLKAMRKLSTDYILLWMITAASELKYSLGRT